METKLLFLTALSFFFVFPRRLLAHHGYAAYELNKMGSLKGVVTVFSMANPHSTLSFDVKNEKGKVERWTVETGHVRMLIENGWSPDTLKPIDTVIFYFHPAKNGSHVVDLVRIEFPDGRVFSGSTYH